MAEIGPKQTRSAHHSPVIPAKAGIRAGFNNHVA